MLRCAPSKQLRISGLVIMLSLIAAALVFVSAPDGDTLTVRDGNVKTIVRLAETAPRANSDAIGQCNREPSECGGIEIHPCATCEASAIGHKQNFAIAFISLRRDSAAGPRSRQKSNCGATADECFSRCRSLGAQNALERASALRDLSSRTRSTCRPRFFYVEIFDTVDETLLGLSGSSAAVASGRGKGHRAAGRERTSAAITSHGDAVFSACLRVASLIGDRSHRLR